VEHGEIMRGDVVVPRGAFRATRAVDASFAYLSSAPRELKHRSTLRLHSATYEVPAQVILLDRDTLQPGESAYAQLRLKEPALLLSGDSYILRISAPATTVGGGVVLDPFPPRRRRRSSEALELLEAFGQGEHQRIIALIISQSLLSGVSYDDILLRCGAPRKVTEADMSALLSSGEVLQVTREPRMFLSRVAFETLKKGLLDEISAYLEANPLKEGMGKEELKTRLPKRSNTLFYTSLLTAMERDGLVVPDREIVRLGGKLARKGVSGEELSGKISSFLQEGGIEPPTVREITERFRCDDKTVRDNLALLVRTGQVARISSDLFYSAQALNGLREKLAARLREKGEITPPEYRELTGLSRKFLIPLLEFFDSEKLTIRVGDKRVLRKR
jgi:selenocysteine-specific elongation factor